MAEHNPAVVIDNGTGYTKMGYSVRNILLTFIRVALCRTRHKKEDIHSYTYNLTKH